MVVTQIGLTTPTFGGVDNKYYLLVSEDRSIQSDQAEVRNAKGGIVAKAFYNGTDTVNYEGVAILTWALYPGLSVTFANHAGTYFLDTANVRYSNADFVAYSGTATKYPSITS